MRYGCFHSMKLYRVLSANSVMNFTFFDKNKRPVLILCAGFIFFLLVSCGIDVYTYVYAPYGSTSPSNEDLVNRFFSFTTNDDENDNVSGFKGTSVYYKIYNADKKDINGVITPPDKLTSDVSAVNSANSSTNTDKAVDKLKELSFNQLRSSNTNPSVGNDPVIKNLTLDSAVKIRLFNEGVDGDEIAYPAGFEINGNAVKNGTAQIIPLRSNTARSDFNFFSDGGAVPSSDDVDVGYTEGVENNYWFVAAFAVSVLTESLTNTYSTVLNLGYIIIEDPDGS